MMRITQDEKKRIKERILVQALESLKVWGREAAPVDKIMKKLGLTSGALYSHFKSKDDLFVQVIVKELERITQMHNLRVQKSGQKMLSEFIEYYLQDEHISNIERGCLFVALGSDLHRLSSSARLEIEVRLEQMFKAMASGLPHKNKNVRLETAKFIFSSMVGTLILARAMKNDQNKKDLLRITKMNLLKIASTNANT
ncbi:MAG: TetR/AcrR family transcriptional regulator [Bdellovibrionaceae bacterium]|nr:TetR/AcrR family transcriptional regulator [Pseudobdellovibrionaceae bacterium]